MIEVIYIVRHAVRIKLFLRLHITLRTQIYLHHPTKWLRNPFRFPMLYPVALHMAL
jgi:hypothetical protein